MDDIRSALMVGAGAVGCAVASKIHTAIPGAVSVLASPSRMERFSAEGFVINGVRMDFPLAPADRAPGNGDEPGLVVVAVKNHQLGQAIADMAPYVGRESLILSLMNGIVSEDTLASAFGREKVPYAMIIGIDAVREGNSTRFTQGGTINFGEAQNPAGAWSERVSRIASFFGRAGLRYSVPEDMIRSLWYKFMINVGINQASAVLGAPYGTFQRLREARRVMEAAMRELIAVSRAKGSGLQETDLESWHGTLRSLSPDAKTSMLQDVESGRKTEVEIFAGTVIELGEETGVATPVNRLLFDLIRTIEQSY
jgi:2-dehydropantoate 2-reductase